MRKSICSTVLVCQMELSEIEFDPRTKILCIKFANTLHLTKKSMFRTDSRMDIFVGGSTCHYEVVSVLALRATVNMVG